MLPKFINVNFWTKKIPENAVKKWHAKDWHAKDGRIFQVLTTMKMRQSLAKDCMLIFPCIYESDLCRFSPVMISKSYRKFRRKDWNLEEIVFSEK